MIGMVNYTMWEHSLVMGSLYPPVTRLNGMPEDKHTNSLPTWKPPKLRTLFSLKPFNLTYYVTKILGDTWY